MLFILFICMLSWKQLIYFYSEPPPDSSDAKQNPEAESITKSVTKEVVQKSPSSNGKDWLHKPHILSIRYQTNKFRVFQVELNLNSGCNKRKALFLSRSASLVEVQGANHSHLRRGKRTLISVGVPLSNYRVSEQLFDLFSL